MKCRPCLRERRPAAVPYGIFRVTGQGFAVIELQLLQKCQVGFLRWFQPRQHCPHRGHFDRVRGDVLAADLLEVVVLFVDHDFVVQLA